MTMPLGMDEASEFSMPFAVFLSGAMRSMQLADPENRELVLTH